MKATVSFFAFTEPPFSIEIHKEERPEFSLGINRIVYRQLNPGGPLQGYIHEDLEVTWSPNGGGEVKLSFVVHESFMSRYERSIRITKEIQVNAEDVGNMALEPIITPEYCIAMGMYVPNAAMVSDLPKTIQIYVTVTRNYENWMGDLFKKIGTGKTRLQQLILPGSHDSGMYGNRFPVQINNVANTQKDDITTQLKLGARFFDFRPGTISPEFVKFLRHIVDSNTVGAVIDELQEKNVPNLINKGLMLLPPLYFLGQYVKHTAKDVVKALARDFLKGLESDMNFEHHIHAAIPGESMPGFFIKIGEFLEAHPSEIVTVKISDAGIIHRFRLPEMNSHPIHIDGKRIDGQELELVQVKDKAMIFAEILAFMRRSGVKVGDKSCLNSTVEELLATNKRLIILFQDEMNVLSSYSDDYLSCDAQKIIAGIEETVKKIDKGEHQKKNLIDLQLQLTASGNTPALIAGIATSVNANATTSPLMGTKPRTDFAAYPLIYDLVPGYANRQGLVTFINDYCDNGLTAQVFQANLRAAEMRGIEVE